MAYILTLDQGTTSSRAIIYDDKLHTVSMAQKPIALSTPKPDFVEQNANEIWFTTLFCIQEALNRANLNAHDISAIAITNQRETCVFWDALTGEPLAPAIVWQDRRTQKFCQQLTKTNPKLADAIPRLTGLRLDPYFSATKIHWALTHLPKVAHAHAQGRLRFGTVDSWLNFKLTGNHTTDISNASRTALFDIHRCDWSDELLAGFGIDRRILPQVLPCDGEFGHTKRALFSSAIPVVAMMGDQQAALYGQGCHDIGQAKNTYGTGCFLLMNVGQADNVEQTNTGAHLHHNDEQSVIRTIAWQQSTLTKDNQSREKPAAHATHYALEGSVFMAGAIVSWLKDNLGILQNSSDIEALANSVPDTDGVVLIPAFTGLGAPHWRGDLSASLTGLTRSHTKAHIAKAALHAIAHQSYDVLHAMQAQSQKPLTELRVDGGAAKNDYLMQFQADILGVPVLRAKDIESTAKGAAMMVARKLGWAQNFYWQCERTFEPSMSSDQRESLLNLWQTRLAWALSMPC